MSANPTVASVVHYPEVERRSGLSEREFSREYKAANRPVVLLDAVDSWPAKRWTFEFFRSRYGDTLVVPNRYDGRWYAAEALKEMRLADFIDGLETKDWNTFPYYLWDNRDIFRRHPELLRGCSVPGYFYDWCAKLPQLQRPGPRLFIGPRGAVTPFHIDFWGTHGWLTNIVGRKRWIVVPPHQKHLLHGVRFGNKVRYEVNPEAPDFDRFPRFREVTAFECTLGPGETMFIPGGWFHYVKSVESCISLTGNLVGPGCFWPAGVNAIKEQWVKRAWGAIFG